MATKKSMWVLFGIFVISAWVFGSAIQVGAETMKCRTSNTATKVETIPVGDVEGHVLGVSIHEGLAFFENGEIARTRNHNAYDTIPGKGSPSIVYLILTFEDGSSIVIRSQRLIVPGQSGISSAQATGELIKGTGRFEGIKGTTSATGKNFPASKGEAARATSDIIFTYTLPTK
jgi:hypothetical protein